MHVHIRTHEFAFIVRDDRDCRHQLLHRLLHAAAAAAAVATASANKTTFIVVGNDLFVRFFFSFSPFELQYKQLVHSNKSEVETSDGKRLH